MNIGKTYLEPNKKVHVALQKLKGIGHFQSNQICDQLGFQQNYKIKDLSYQESEALIRILEKFYIFGVNLQISINLNLQRLQKINSTRGLRYKRGLPVRGQRTRTNAKTAKRLNKIIQIKQRRYNLLKNLYAWSHFNKIKLI